jgi:hypothetical protein
MNSSTHKKFIVPNKSNAKHPVFYSILQNIVNHKGTLTDPQKKWLIDVALHLEAGLSPADSLALDISESVSGKRSNYYQQALGRRDHLLYAVFESLPGKKWARYAKIIKLLDGLDEQLRNNELYEPLAEIEKDLLRADRVLKLPRTSNGLNTIIEKLKVL